MGLRFIPTRRASSTSAATDQMGKTIRKRMDPRSPFSASATYGESREEARTWCAKYGQAALRPRAGSGGGVVPEEPASTDPRAAHPTGRENAGPLCLLRHIGQLSTITLV